MILRATTLFIAMLFAVGRDGDTASAQEWPLRHVDVIAPAPAGSVPDLVTRIVSEQWQRALGKPFTVVNRPGAGGNLGMQAVAKAEPNGYTIGIALPGPLIVNPILFETGYQLADFEPIALVGLQGSVLFVDNSVNVKTLEEFVTWVRASPQPVRYAISGIGTVTHLAMESLRQERDLRMEYVIYKGSTEAAHAVGNGEINIAILPALNAAALAEAGKGRMIAITSAQRSSFFPDIPTFAESGMPGFEASVWFGFVAPSGTPKAVVDKLADVLQSSVTGPEIQEHARTMQIDVNFAGPAAFAQILKGEEARWRSILARTGLAPK